MKRARILRFEEAIQYHRKTVWIQTRDMCGSLPVEYAMENAPWVRFRFLTGNDEMMFLVKKEWYGKTWRCFDIAPEDEDSFLWEEVDDG